MSTDTQNPTRQAPLKQVWPELDPAEMTPEQTARYIEITDPKFMEAAFAETLQQTHPANDRVLPRDLSVIG